MKPLTIKRVLVAALFPCLVLIALFFFSDRDGGAKTGAPCDIGRGPCVQEAENGVKIEFNILPKPVIAMSELFFVITVTKNSALLSDADVLLDLSMPGMFMGRNRPVLKQTSKGRYEGKGVITRCASGRKTWQATVTVENNGKTAVADFVFEVH
jgi:hypothetical protein